MKPGSVVKSIGLSVVAFSCGLLGMIVLMASRRGGSLLTWNYFLYVFPYLCVVTVPLGMTQFFIHRFQFRRAAGAKWVFPLFSIYATMNVALGYFAALAFDF